MNLRENPQGFLLPFMTHVAQIIPHVSILFHWEQSSSCPSTHNDSGSGSLILGQAHPHLKNPRALFLISSPTDRVPVECRLSASMFTWARASRVWGVGEPQAEPPQACDPPCFDERIWLPSTTDDMLAQSRTDRGGMSGEMADPRGKGKMLRFYLRHPLHGGTSLWKWLPFNNRYPRALDCITCINLTFRRTLY